jgi:hypothetical protein
MAQQRLLSTAKQLLGCYGLIGYFLNDDQNAGSRLLLIAAHVHCSGCTQAM